MTDRPDAAAIATIAARTTAIVVAAGSSRRMGGRDKIWEPIGGRPVLWHAVRAIAAAGLARIVIVTSAETGVALDSALRGGGWPAIAAIVPGGRRRQDSVRAGLAEAGAADWIAVHDGARPLVTPDLIRRGLAAVAERGAVVAAVPVKDTIKVTEADGRVVQTPPRETLRSVQTPQIFRADLLRQAHAAIADDVTDDAMMVEAIGHPVYVFAGDPDNLKVTTPEDVIVAEMILAERGRRCG